MFYFPYFVPWPSGLVFPSAVLSSLQWKESSRIHQTNSRRQSLQKPAQLVNPGPHMMTELMRRASVGLCVCVCETVCEWILVRCQLLLIQVVWLNTSLTHCLWVKQRGLWEDMKGKVEAELNWWNTLYFSPEAYLIFKVDIKLSPCLSLLVLHWY